MKSLLRFRLLALALFFVPNSSFSQFLGQQTLSQSSYVIDQSGTLWAWGWNFYGQLGVGDRANRSTPTIVPLPAGASQWTCVAGGATFALAIADTDKLYAWGVNDKGQIGQGYAGGNIFGGPTRIPNPPTVTGWKWVSAGAAHCEALTNDGRLFAWGDNSQGQLGPGNTNYLPQPEEVEFPTGVRAWTAVAAGPGYTEMIAQDHRLYGCGFDSLSTFNPYEGPQLAQINHFRAYSCLPSLAASYRIESKIDEDHLLVLAFDNPYLETSDKAAAYYMAAVAAGARHVLQLTVNGALLSGGDNTYGQLGLGAVSNGSTGNIPFPAGVTQFIAIAAGLKHSLAIGNDGWLYAWGDDSLGELGIDSTVNKNKPTRVFRVCSPISMTGSFSSLQNPTSPFSLSLNVQNTNGTTSLTNGNAFLTYSLPLKYNDSAALERFPTNIAPSSSESLTWDGSIGFNIILDTPIVFAYVKAQGSSPLLVPGGVVVPAIPIEAYVNAQVIDSVTNDPIPGASVFLPPATSIDSTDKNGSFTDSLRLGVFGSPDSFACTILKENYNTFSTSYQEYDSIDNETFILSPSTIQGNFTLPTGAFLGDSIVKVYFPDSIIGYAISARNIYRSMDTGDTWKAIYSSNTGLHDIKFRDIANGIVVGDNGTILATSDSGKTWTMVTPTSANLRAVAIIDADTAWAVGDNGTLLKKSGENWTVLPSLGTDTLNAINFFDAEHGVIGTLGGEYLYSSGSWNFLPIYGNPIPDIQTVEYLTPRDIMGAGTNGEVIKNGFVISTWSNQTIRNMYFLNSLIGFVAGDSMAMVTYDEGATWAPLKELPHSATSINFFSLSGHAASNAVSNYVGVPNTVSGIVRGRITYGKSAEPIEGAEIRRYYTIDTLSGFMDSTYSNEQGNFVFSGIDSVFKYEYRIHYSDSGIAKLQTFPNIKPRHGQIITLNYNDFPVSIDTIPPDTIPPDTIPPDTLPHDTLLSVGAEPASAQSLAVHVSGENIVMTYEVFSPATLSIRDALGREVWYLPSDGSFVTASVSIPALALPVGTYYALLKSSSGTVIRKFELLR